MRSSWIRRNVGRVRRMLSSKRRSVAAPDVPAPNGHEAEAPAPTSPPVVPFEPTFEGWGMRTDRALPWDDAHQWASFRESLEAMRSFDLGPLMRTMVPDIDMLMWRHWVVAFAVRYVASMAAEPGGLTLAECGVGDGMSAFIALNELKDIAAHAGPAFEYSMHLYDSFAPMRPSDLTENEQWLADLYESLSISRTKTNLAGFDDALVWHVGYLPEALEAAPASPERLHWLHIDLNCAGPTIDACAYFLPRLHPRGAILFDDYGDRTWFETRLAVDEFFADVPGLLLKFPTGQAMFLNRGDEPL